MITLCRCIFFGWGMKEVHRGLMTFVDPKQNKPTTKIEAIGSVRLCLRCCRESFQVYSWREVHFENSKSQSDLRSSLSTPL